MCIVVCCVMVGVSAGRRASDERRRLEERITMLEGDLSVIASRGSADTVTVRQQYEERLAAAERERTSAYDMATFD